MVKEFVGKIIKFTEVESGVSGAGKQWQKQGVILETKNEYNPEVCVMAFGKDKMHSMNKLEVGMVAGILCNVYSREFNGKWYSSIDGYHFTNQSNNPDALKKIETFVTSDEEDAPF